MDKHWALPVQEFMTRRLISVLLDTPLEDVQRTLEEHEISAVPVLDPDGVLRGILSTKDLLRAARIEMGAPEVSARVILPKRTAADLMRSAVLTVDERTAVGKAGQEMLRQHVHRLIVVCDGRPSGVISTRDAMRAIAMARVKTPLAEVMTLEVQTIPMDLPVDAATERLDDANVRGLIVLDDDSWPIGVFTHTEAIRASGLPASMRKIPVERVMSYETICLDTRTPVDRVANYARQMRVRRILAVENNRLKGVATGFDLLRIMASAA